MRKIKRERKKKKESRMDVTGVKADEAECVSRIGCPMNFLNFSVYQRPTLFVFSINCVLLWLFTTRKKTNIPEEIGMSSRCFQFLGRERGAGGASDRSEHS